MVLLSPYFPGVFASVQCHVFDGVTTDIQLSPDMNYYAALSPAGVGLFSVRDRDKLLLGKFRISNDISDKHGYLRKILWISNSMFCCLTTFGHILLFNLSKTTEIKLFRIISSGIFTCFAKHHNDLCMGDEEGQITIISTNNKILATQKLLEVPIKSIQINNEVGLILAADGSVWKIQTGRHPFVATKLQLDQCTHISIHKTQNLGAALTINGQIRVTDFDEMDLSINFKKSMSCTSFTWAPDGYSLFLVFLNGTCGYWNYMHRRFQQFDIKELSECHCACFSGSQLFAATSVGLIEIPFYQVSRGPSPVLFHRERVIECRKTAGETIPVTYNMPDAYSSQLQEIRSVVGDIKCRFYAVAGISGVLLLSRTSGKWLRPNQKKIVAKCMCWLDRILVIANVDERKVKCRLEFYQLIPFEVVRVINLPSIPTAMDSDDKRLVCSLPGKLLVVDGSSESFIDLTGVPVQCAVHSASNSVIALTQTRELYIFRDGQVVHTFPNVSDFFIDTGFGLLFVTQQHKVFVLSLFKKLCLNPFFETSDVVLGVYPSCSCLMSLRYHIGRPLSITANPFFDISIVSEMRNPDKAAETISLMRSSPAFPNLLRQVLVFALREKLGVNCVLFLEHFPDHRMEALSGALRAVESPERQGVFQMTGPPSYLFMEFAGVSQKCGRIVEFEQRKEVPRSALMSAALLLPVIMEEEGPLVGFPASLFILSKIHDNIDYIESLMRFLDPLLAPPETTDDNKVRGVGMIFEPADYYDLKARLLNVIDESLLDLVDRAQPGLLLSFAECFNVRLGDFFMKYCVLDSDHDIVTLMDRLAPQITAGDLSRSDCQALYPETMRGGWNVWTAALMLVSGDSAQAFSFVAQHPELKLQLRGSQWQHFIDT